MRYFEQFMQQRAHLVRHPRVKKALEKLTATDKHVVERQTAIRGDADHKNEWKARELQALAVSSIKTVTKDVAHDMRRLQREVDATRPKVPRLKETDTASTLWDIAIWQMLQGKSVADRISIISSDNASPRMLAAVMRIEPGMLGVPAELHTAIVDRMLRETHPAEYQFIEETRADIEIADAGLATVMRDLRTCAPAMTDPQWSKLVTDTTGPLNAELAKEFETPVTTAAIDVDAIAQRVRMAPMKERDGLIERLSADKSADWQAAMDRELARLRGDSVAA